MRENVATPVTWRTSLIRMLAGPEHAESAEWRSKSTIEKRFELRRALSRYVVLWFLAMLLALVQYVIYSAHLPPDAAKPHDELAATLQLKELPKSGLAAYDPACDTACKVLWITSQMHEKQGAAIAIFKSFVIVSLAWLWFATFTFLSKHAEWAASSIRDFAQGAVDKRRWWHGHKRVKSAVIFLSITPALVLVLAMSGEYEPAVFVMALAAIYVAAEHYSSLEKTKDDLEAQVNELRVHVGQRLEKTRDDLAAQVRELRFHVGQILNADGMNEWRQQLYEAYRVAEKRIDAVVRYFDIDREWWDCHTAQDPWTEYKQRADTDEKNHLLLRVLTDSACLAKIQYVADLPMPPVPPPEPVPANTGEGELAGWGVRPVAGGEKPLICQSVSQPLMAKYFRDLLGLAWQLAILHEVGKRRWNSPSHPARFCYTRIKISGAPSWMHVVDERTFQVIDRQDASIATVRELNRDVFGESIRVRLSDWARRNVRLFASRGTLADEHLLATLRHAALLYGGSERDPLDMHRLGPILCLLGMDDYLSAGAHRDFFTGGQAANPNDTVPALLPTRAIARHMCITIFQTFLRQRFEGKNPVLVCHLAEALL